MSQQIDEQDRVVCPAAPEKKDLVPKEVWKAKDGKTRYGILPEHSHQGTPCDYSDLVGEVIRETKKD